MKTLIIEDNQDVVHSIRLCFQFRWPDAEIVSSTFGSKGIEMVESESPDIIILDLGLPDMDGTKVLTEIRRFSDIPIIVLSVRNEEIEKVSCLESGADDYICKPFSSLDLLARIKTVLRRQKHLPVEGADPQFVAGKLEVNYASRQVVFDGTLIPLTPIEYSLLCCLISNRNKVLLHRTILTEVWGEEYDGNDTIKTFISQLRRKLDAAGANSDSMTISVRGVGYKFVSPL